MTKKKIRSLTSAKKGPSSAILFLFVCIFFIVATVVLFKLYEREKPGISLPDEITRIGRATSFSIIAEDHKSGIHTVSVNLVQGEKEKNIFTKKITRQGYFADSGPNRFEQLISVNARKLGLKDGKASLEIEVSDFSWWSWMTGNKSTMSYSVTIDTRPPKATIVESQRYILQGGSGMVVYRLDEEVVKHGVFVNGYFYPGFPLKKDQNIKVAFIGLPYDVTKVDKAYIAAVDAAGNEGRTAFGMVVKEKKLKQDQIRVSDNFMTLKVPELLQDSPDIGGDLLQQYLYINNDIRKQNYEKVISICQSPYPERLWRGRFLRMPGSKRAGFGDQRTYYYKGQEIDHQTHLGIDLASTRHADARAANRGIVKFADYLGIYGNTVIIDHGQGVFSLYAHLSQISVAVGETVEQKSLIGLTGSSGMAGGDHLHFSMLINGIFVTPLEWWDLSWISLNIEDILKKIR